MAYTFHYSGNGHALSLGSSDEGVNYSYNEFSIINSEGLDYGFITEVESFQEDYGLITESIILPSQRVDYGFITDNTTILPFGKLSTLGSFADERIARSSVGGLEFLLFGSSFINIISSHIGQSRVEIAGTSTIGIKLRYFASGKLSNFVSSSEVTSNTESNKGIFKFAGASAESFSKGQYSGKGTSTFNGESIVRPTLGNEGQGRIVIDGDSIIRFRLRYISTGSLFGFGSKIEKSTYSYNQSSVVTLESLDYGFISEPEVDSSDYGSILSNTPYSYNIDDYGFLSPNKTDLPYGKFRVQGSVVDSTTNIEIGSGKLQIYGEGIGKPTPRQIGSGSLTISNTNSAIVGIRLRFFGSGTLSNFISSTNSKAVTEESAELFKFTGKSTESFSKGKFTGDGSVFTFISSTETSTNSNIESPTLFRISGTPTVGIRLRYITTGSIFGFGSKIERATYSYNQSSVVTLESLDYGFISEPEVDSSDYGLITDRVYYTYERDDYGFLSPNKTDLPYGSLYISGDTTKLLKVTLNYFGSGSLFGFSSTTESITTAETSKVLFRFSGSGAESTTPTTEIGSGSIFTFVSATETTSVSEVSSELFRFSGSLGLKVIIDYPGSGSLFGFSSTTESTTNAETSKGLFRFSGSAAESTTPTTEIGSGSIFTFVSFTESTSVSEVSSELFRFSGTSVEKNTESYVGSGSIFAFSSTTESTTNTKPETTELFRFSGSAAESTTPTTEIGSGSIFTFVSFTESTSVSEVSSELFRFSGAAKDSANLTYIGTTQINLTSTSIVRVQLKEKGSGSIRTSGSSIERSTVDELGSGSAFTFLNRVIFDSTGKVRYVSGDESTTSIPPTRTLTIRTSGEVGIYFQYIEIGSGTLTISGEAIAQPSAIHYGSGQIVIDIESTESITPAPHIGSGSIFTFVSATESIGSNPPETTELFRISGTSVEKNTESYVGEIESNITGFSNIITTLTYVGNGGLSITDSAIEKNTESYVGSGSIFTFVSATESIGSNPPETTELFRISGTSVEKNTESYVGSGSIFTFVSFTETSASSERGSSLFKLSGSGSESITPATEIGSGSLFQYGQRVLLDPTGKVRFLSADESTTSVPPLEVNTIKISGSKLEQTGFAYTGSGAIFGFIGASESVGYSEFSTELFKITGSASEKNTESYVGSGSIFTFDSRTESISTTEISKVLLRFTGSSEENFSTGTYSGSGSIFTFVSFTESTSISEVSSELFTLGGSAVVRKTEYFNGSGSIFAFSSTTTSRPVKYIGIHALFKLFGISQESFTQSTYIGNIQSIIDIDSDNKKVEYDSPKPSQITII
jgi:hypothetical protein